MFLTGSGLADAEFYIGYFDSLGKLATHPAGVHTVTDTYAMVTLPGAMPASRFATYLIWRPRPPRLGVNRIR